MRARGYRLALDQSTSATKAVLFAEDGRVIARESREHAQHHPQPGWVEHDAEEIWRNVLAAIAALASRSGGDLDGLRSLSVTNQRETLVIFDRTSGRPLRPAIVWQCRRGEGHCTRQIAAGHAAVIHERTGLRIDGYFTASKLQWVMENEPDVARRLSSGEACAGTMDSYLIHRLTGGAVFATDATNASRTLLFDLKRGAWDDELCSWWGVPRAALPTIRDCGEAFGETTVDGALARPVPIRGVMGDSQAALLAQRCFRPGEAKVTLGTGSSLLLNIGPQLRYSGQGVLTALAWSFGGRPCYAFEGLIVSSAATLAWLRDGLGVIGDFAECEPLAAALADNEGVYLVPAFAGLGLPYWRPEARAAIVGLTAASDRRHLVRAGLEAMAYQVADALAALATEAGCPLEALRVDGGPSQNRLLMQFMADVTRAVLTVAQTSDASAWGAVLAALVGESGGADPEEIELPAPAGTLYPPRMPQASADHLLAGWRAAVKSVYDPFHS